MANQYFQQFLFNKVKMLTLLLGDAHIGTAGQSSRPDLGAAASFGTLAASTITNTGGTVVTGNLGVSPGNAVTGFPPGTVTGVQHLADALAAKAQVDSFAAFNDGNARPFNTDLSGTDLGGLTLGAGVYKFSSSAGLTGTLVLDAAGNPNAVFIFQIGSTLTTAASAVVSLINGAVPGNVFFMVGSSATLGATNTFKGNILALASITVGSGSSVVGGLFAHTAAITLGNNAVTSSPGSGPVAGVVSSITGNGIKAVTKLALGIYRIDLTDNYVGLLQALYSMVSPLLGSPVASTALVAGVPYSITVVGTTNWAAVGVPANQVPQVGLTFVATGTASGTGTATAVGISGVADVETLPGHDMTSIGGKGVGCASVIMQVLDKNGIPVSPLAGSVLHFELLLRNSSVKV